MDKMKMKGKTVAFIGIDGAGKTTIIERVMANLRKEGVVSKRIYMGLGRDIKIPFLKRLIRLYTGLRYRASIKSKGKVGESRDNYRIRGFGWLAVQYFEFWSRYFGARKFRKKGHVFFDRYFYDGLVFAEGKNFNFFKKLIPKPDLCFLIYAPADIIRSRKEEANVKNINDFYDKIDLVSKDFKIEKIDNTRDIDLVVKEIINKIKNG